MAYAVRRCNDVQVYKPQPHDHQCHAKFYGQARILVSLSQVKPKASQYQANDDNEQGLEAKKGIRSDMESKNVLVDK